MTAMRYVIAAIIALFIALPAEAGEVAPHPLGKCISTVAPGTAPDAFCWHMVFVGELASD